MSFRSAARAYVRARGGSSGAAKTSRAGRAATARLGGFLAGVAADGIKPTLERFGLVATVGNDAQQVLAAISNAIAPTGASREEAVARRATNDVLKELYDKYAIASEGLARLEAMPADDIRKAVEASISTYIYYCWLEELGSRIEDKSMSGAEAERLERDMKVYVRDVVHLDLKDVDVLTLDWAGDAGGKVIEKLYAEAYQVLGGSV
ncbi:Qat anti-phage system associated protein QatB [Polyangium jinanense]|uniref:Qat anti-phage system associated protein QatB n=1 Tax=Polyangium jinanense TaxID=2829994 RepID=UPI0023416010|nr:Qat anti-phage system associated protein QatB [Polyangium jinanense]